MCKLGLTKIWFIRKLIRCVMPTALPIDFRLEDAIAEYTTNADTSYARTRTIRLVGEKEAWYEAYETSGDTFKTKIAVYKHIESTKIRILQAVKKTIEIPLACELDEEEFEKRLMESRARCAKYDNKYSSRVKYGVLNELVEGRNNE